MFVSRRRFASLSFLVMVAATMVVVSMMATTVDLSHAVGARHSTWSLLSTVAANEDAETMEDPHEEEFDEELDGEYEEEYEGELEDEDGEFDEDEEEFSEDEEGDFYDEEDIPVSEL